MGKDQFDVKIGLAEMLKGGVIMDVQMLKKQKYPNQLEHVLLWH